MPNFLNKEKYFLKYYWIYNENKKFKKYTNIFIGYLHKKIIYFDHLITTKLCHWFFGRMS